jgi:hypothetical protein
VKAGQIYKKLTDHFKLNGLKKEDLLPFLMKLREYKYDEASIFGRLGISDIDDIIVRYLPAYLQFNLAENSPLDRLIKIYIFALKINEDELIDILGDEITATLYKACLLEKEDGMVFSSVALFPCLGGVFATDHMFTTAYVSRSVYPLGIDSYSLARVLMDVNAGTTLDLCTGCGVHAILAAKTSGSVIGVDLNPRAVNFARFNALLNQVDNIEFLQGNLYEPVAGKKFDWIIANPPFVPSPDKRLYFRHGSPSGEAILQTVLSGLPEFLNDGGYAQTVNSIVYHENEKYEDKIRGWLDKSELQLLILGTRFGSVDRYILDHITVSPFSPGYNEELIRWVKSYKEQKIIRIGDGQMFLKKTPGSKPETLSANYRMPLTKSTDNPSRILDLMENRNNEDFKKSLLDKCFKISDQVDFFWDGTQPDGFKKYGLVFKNSSLLVNEVLDIFSVIILDIITANPRKGSEIREIFEKAAGHHPIFDKNLFLKKLLDLMVDGIIEYAEIVKDKPEENE